MPYSIKYTDFANKGSITIEDSIINTTTSLKLPGKSTTAYGSAIAENFLHILENFAAASAPSNPVEGQLWYDTTPAAEQLQIYNGSNWVPANNITKSASQPTVNQEGDLWVDKNNSQLYLYTNASGWVLIGPEFSQGLSTGASPKVIAGTDDINYNVLQVDISGKPAAVISTNSFTPKTKIEGFTTINPGYNLTTANITGAGVLKYLGRAEKAENLIVGSNTVSASNFLRGDAISTTSFALNLRNNTGANFGINSEMNIGIEGTAGLIQHNVAGSSIDFKVKNDGLLKNIVRIDSAMRVGINNAAPDETLHISGNLKVSPIATDVASGKINVLAVTDSTDVNTGSVTTIGGIGIAKSMYVGNNLNVGFVAGSFTGGQIKTEKIVPGTTLSGTIGTDALKFSSIYARKFYGDVEGNVTGTVTGVAGSANRLSSSTTFKIEGDIITTADQVFTGQGGTTTFNTALGTQFIANKTSVIETLSDDEVLINRVRLSTGIKKVSVARLLSSVPTTPVGAIMPYGGQSQPVGWFLCDGTEYSLTTYKLLYDVIGFLYKANPVTGKFAVPDFRGRVPLGVDKYGSDAAAGIVPAASVVGAQSGQRQKTLVQSNLPQHEHNLQDDNGVQFYAVNTSSGAASGGAIAYGSVTGSGTGQALSNSGEVLSSSAVGQAFDIMNPYMAISYIIYHGVLE